MRRFLSPPWLVRHVVALILVTAFLYLGWWQVQRAAAGNVLSYAYAVEWPVFAAFVVGLWVHEIRSERRPAATPPKPARPVRGPIVVPVIWPADQAGAAATGDAGAPASGEVPADGEDAALSEYNEYLAWLAADPRRRPSQYRTLASGTGTGGQRWKTY